MNGLIENTIYFFTDLYSKIIIKLVVAIIIILVGFIIGKIVGKIFHRLLVEFKINNFFFKLTGIKANIDKIISSSVMYIIDFFVIIIALDAIALTPKLAYLFSMALIVIIVFSIIIGIKDIIPNAIAGIIVYRKKTVTAGEHLLIGKHKGTVDKVTLLETIIKKRNGDLIYIPNSSLLKYDIVKKKRFLDRFKKTD